MASCLLPKSPVSLSLWDEVPHIFIPKSHLEPREFLISSAKRLLQHNRHKADIRGTATFCPLLGYRRGDSVQTTGTSSPFGCVHGERIERLSLELIRINARFVDPVI